MKSKRSNLTLKLLVTCLTIAGTIHAQLDPSNGCAGVPVLTQNATCVPNSYHMEGTTMTSSGGFEASCAAGLNRDDGWYQFVATGTDADIDLTGNRNHCLSVWTACGGGTELGCDYAAAGNTATVSLTGLTPGTTYYIFVERRQSNNNSDMDGDICIHDPLPVNNDCDIATQVCSSTGFPGNSNGPGTQELNAGNRGCLAGNENESSWYLISIGTSGTLQFAISPTNGSDDYDFAVWGPNESCPPAAAPIRCSWAAGGGNTGVNSGMNSESPQFSENALGDRWVDDMNVTVGEFYTICIDNWSTSNQPFNFTFGGSAGISCIPLPVELLSFDGEIDGDINKLTWTTKSENNNAFFTIERSVDGQTWTVLGYENGANNSSKQIDYNFRDYSFDDVLNYYRLSQTDYDGTTVQLKIIALNNADPKKQLVKIVNMMGEEVGPDYDGLMIYIYADGSVEKRMKAE